MQSTSFNREEAPFSFTDLLREVLSRLRWALQQRNWLIAALVVGVMAGTGYAWMKKTTYTARLTFVVANKVEIAVLPHRQCLWTLGAHN
jgi:uncharacterized protein involved in exopolysaccharide biosynthesis